MNIPDEILNVHQIGEGGAYIFEVDRDTVAGAFRNIMDSLIGLGLDRSFLVWRGAIEVRTMDREQMVALRDCLNVALGETK